MVFVYKLALAQRQLFLSYRLHRMALRCANLGSTVLSEQAVEGLLLSDLEGTRLDARVVYTQQRVDVIHGLSAYICKLLDLSRGVLDFVITELQSELLDARLDCVPTGQAMSDRHVAREAKILRFKNLVGRGVIEDRLGMNAGLVSECDVATGARGKPPKLSSREENIYIRDGVREGHIDFDSFRDEILNLTQHAEFVLGLDIFGVGRI